MAILHSLNGIKKLPSFAFLFYIIYIKKPVETIVYHVENSISNSHIAKTPTQHLRVYDAIGCSPRITVK